MVERLICNEDVAGSIPVGSSGGGCGFESRYSDATLAMLYSLMVECHIIGA